jgi:hypothetical protein
VHLRLHHAHGLLLRRLLLLLPCVRMLLLLWRRRLLLLLLLRLLAQRHRRGWVNVRRPAAAHSKESADRELADNERI